MTENKGMRRWQIRLHEKNQSLEERKCSSSRNGEEKYPCAKGGRKSKSETEELVSIDNQRGSGTMVLEVKLIQNQEEMRFGGRDWT